METTKPKHEATARRPVFFAAIAVLFIPSLVFVIAALAGGMAVPDTAAAYAAQVTAARTNLAVVSAMGLIPVALLAIVVWISSKISRLASKRRLFAIAGVVAIVPVIIWANCEFWFRFLPERTFLGFPHGLEFVIGPLVFAPIAMLVAILIAGILPAAKQ